MACVIMHLAVVVFSFTASMALGVYSDPTLGYNDHHLTRDTPASWTQQAVEQQQKMFENRCATISFCGLKAPHHSSKVKAANRSTFLSLTCNLLKRFPVL